MVIPLNLGKVNKTCKGRTCEKVKTSTLIGDYKKLIPTWMDDLKGFRTLVEEVISSVVGFVREESEEDVIKSLQSHDQTLTDE